MFLVRDQRLVVETIFLRSAYACRLVNRIEKLQRSKANEMCEKVFGPLNLLRGLKLLCKCRAFQCGTNVLRTEEKL